MAKLVVEQADGTEVILAILGPGEVISALTIGDGSGNATLDRVARRDSAVLDRP